METLLFLSFQNLPGKGKDIVKMISETSEKFKVSIRNIRRKYIDLVKDYEKDKKFQLMKVKTKRRYKNQLINQLTKLKAYQNKKKTKF